MVHGLSTTLTSINCLSSKLIYKQIYNLSTNTVSIKHKVIFNANTVRNLFLTMGISTTLYILLSQSVEHTDNQPSSSSATATTPVNTPTGNDDNLPTYTNTDVASHNTMEKRIWISYRGDVYDITDFIPLHPGGNKILLGAGNDIELYWNFYQQHMKPYVQELFAQYKIGKLDPVSIQENKEKASKNAIDPFINDPVRDPALIIRSLRPFNGETPNDILTDEYLTPQNILFTRNHLPVPDIDIDKYRLIIEGVPNNNNKNNTKQV